MLIADTFCVNNSYGASARVYGPAPAPSQKTTAPAVALLFWIARATKPPLGLPRSVKSIVPTLLGSATERTPSGSGARRGEGR